MSLHRCHQRVSDLMIGDDQFLFICQNSVLLLVSRNDDFNALLKVGLVGKFSAVPHRAESRFIYDIGKFRAGSACCHPRYFVKIDVLAALDLPGVNLEDILPALEIGEFHGHAAVETAGPCQRGIERLGAVSRSEDHDTGVLFKSVHLREKLVRGLLALVIAAYEGTVTLFADRVDLIDKDDAGCLFLGLPEQVADL